MIQQYLQSLFYFPYLFFKAFLDTYKSINFH